MGVKNLIKILACSNKDSNITTDITLSELYNTEHKYPNIHTCVLKHKTKPSLLLKYSNEPCIETTCFLFNSITQTTQVKKIESGETLWQINWVRIEEPSPGTNLRTNDGQRLWFRTTIKDVSGPLTLYIREQAALSLSGSASAEEFEQAFQDGNLWFPQMASVKVVRKPASEQTAAQPAQLAQQTGTNTWVGGRAQPINYDP